jgi:GWxTD domain-containing protein
MRVRYGISGALAVLTLSVPGGQVQADILNLSTDYCAYRLQGDTSNSYVEIYYNLPRGQLDFRPDSVGYLALIDFEIEVRNMEGALVDSAGWRAGCRVDDLSIVKETEFLISDMIAETFPAGEYMITITAVSGENKGTSSFKMIVPPFESGKLSLSSLELAFEVSPDSLGKFVKAGHRVLPNPSGRFMQGSGPVYIYAEAYGLDNSPRADSIYTIAIGILDPEGRELKSIPPAQYRKPGESAVILTGFSIATLRNGVYKVRLTLSDGDRSLSADKNFTIVASPEYIRQERLLAILKQYPRASKIETEEDAEKFRDDIFYIATPEELKLYDSLNLQGKTSFQRDFWAARDPDPSTPVNEFQLEHYRRLKYVEENFSQYKGFVEGWRSDQGRVYILYGEPSDIERNPSSIEERSWERWWYHGLEGGVYFVFVDFEDSGYFTLVHSSKQNEVKDYNWEDKVKMTVFQR